MTLYAHYTASHNIKEVIIHAKNKRVTIKLNIGGGSINMPLTEKLRKEILG